MPFPDSKYPSVIRGYTATQSLRLMNAAPSMLVALRLGLTWSENDGAADDDPMVGPDERAFRSLARAAIDRVEGVE